MKVLGIETSCDETSAAVVTGEGQILSNVIFSQIDQHQLFGGVVPEIAARAHLDAIGPVIKQAMGEANTEFKELDAIAVTGGPGLIGGVLIGVQAAKAIALTHCLPFLALNHLEAHALTARMGRDIPFPYLLLLASGGHCQILVVQGVGHYTLLGKTIDDAIGEAFDKVAKMLDLPYPGGPQIERLAALYEDRPLPPLPRPLIHDKSRPYDFSLSGLKTAVRLAIDKGLEEESLETLAPKICRAFQEAVGDIIASRCQNTILWAKENSIPLRHLVIGGGVGANQYIGGRLKALCSEHGLEWVAPPQKLCTDNGAMVAWAGIERLLENKVDSLDFAPRPRWPLESMKG